MLQMIHCANDNSIFSHHCFWILGPLHWREPGWLKNCSCVAPLCGTEAGTEDQLEREGKPYSGKAKREVGRNKERSR